MYRGEQMPFPARQLGCSYETGAHQISTREVLAFAAALGADEYLDDARPGGLVALPSFCVALEWPAALIARAASHPELSDEESLRAVHAGQDSIFHRPFRPGNLLSTHARVVCARQARAGVVTLTKFVTRGSGGEPVVTSWSTTIFRDVQLAGEAGVLEAPPPIPAPSELKTPTTAVSIRIPRALPIVYSECSGIWNPIHSERAVALKANLPDIIVHGTATWALAGLELSRVYGAAGRQLRRLTGRFVGMVVPGESVEVHHAAARAGGVFFELRATSGQVVIDCGFADFR